MGTSGRGEGVGPLPGSHWADYTLPPQFLTRSPGHQRDWIRACKGGSQALNIGLAYPETFGYVGGFSSAPDTKAPPQLVPDPAVPMRLKLLWLACGNRDGLIRISQGVHAYLREKGVPHVWHVDGNAHDTTECQNNLHLLSQRIFK